MEEALKWHRLSPTGVSKDHANVNECDWIAPSRKLHAIVTLLRIRRTTADCIAAGAQGYRHDVHIHPNHMVHGNHLTAVLRSSTLTAQTPSRANCRFNA